MMRDRLGFVLVVLLVATSGCATVNSQTAPASTLDKLTATRTIALGYRESSIPFSYVGADTTPLGYSVELCTHIVADLQRQIPNLHGFFSMGVWGSLADTPFELRVLKEERWKRLWKDRVPVRTL